MPDLPTPQDAAEATLFSECWDAVLSYADLCTGGSATARQLASEAFSLGIREARAAEAEAETGTGGRSFGRRARTPRLPRIPLLLTAVRHTTAAWEAKGQGGRLDPDLRLWLNSEKAARFSGPPLERPLALRGLRDMQEPDAALLWLAEVEALPLTAVARRLGLDPESAADELQQVRGVFRDRCHRNHLDTPLTEECRSYARLLDAVTRSPGADIPADLSRHLARCVECAEAAACLRLDGSGTGLPAALAGGVIGWGGLAYLERRRRAVESGLSRGVADDLGESTPEPKESRARIGRAGMLVAAAVVSLLALVVSLVPFDSDGGSVEGEAVGRQPVGDQVPPFGSPPLGSASDASTSSTSSPRPSDSDSGDGSGSASGAGSDKATQGDSSSSAEQGEVEANPSEPAVCHARYELVNEWPDGFQATVTVKTRYALDTWRVSWKFPDGQKVTSMWDGTFDQDGSRVTATAADYNKSVASGNSFSVGFLASRKGGNSAPDEFTLNGRSCTHSG
ncbi:cellulose binding domain-containing protein [Streptomyces sp. 2A115]|uniref:cellulose binding domain-containing protein n=1 Tax=Streptomyces sp. 2A115 TaxID=3457439 RepID=UPI003FD5C961